MAPAEGCQQGSLSGRIAGGVTKRVTNSASNQVVLDEEVWPDAQEDSETGSPER